MDLIKGREYLVSKGLNPSQIDAVMDFSHDLLVLSTAGSGKTRVISEKIAFALNYMGYEPSSILALTYTKKAAEEMRNRISSLCGNRVRLDELKISTFNAYGMSLISKYMSDYEYDVVDEIDQQIIIKGIKEEMIARGNTSCKDAKTKDLVDLIAKTKCSGIRPENQAAVHKTAKNATAPHAERSSAQISPALSRSFPFSRRLASFSSLAIGESLPSPPCAALRF